MTTPDGPSVSILGTRLGTLPFAAVLQWAETVIRSGQRASVCHVSVHGVLEAEESPAFAAALAGADLCTLDGMPLVWLARWRGHRAERVYGPDFMAALLQRTATWADRPCRHYFYGSTPEVLGRLRQAAERLGSGVVVAGTMAPPFRPLSSAEEEAVAAAINACTPDVVWIGLGLPKQELWMARNRPRLQAPLLVAVGAAFDFLAGTKPQAPRWMRSGGLEWLFRAVTEPRRLGRRYLRIVPRFLWLLLCRRL